MESSRSAPNDQFRAQLYHEASDTSPAELARKVNAVIAQAVQTGRGYPAVKVRTAGSNTYPVYGKNSRNIEGWRMRADLLLESKDSAAISELLARLQQMKLALGNVSQMPSPATRKEVEAGLPPRAHSTTTVARVRRRVARAINPDM